MSSTSNNVGIYDTREQAWIPFDEPRLAKPCRYFTDANPRVYEIWRAASAKNPHLIIKRGTAAQVAELKAR